VILWAVACSLAIKANPYPVDPSDLSIHPSSPEPEDETVESELAETNGSMEEYYRLRQEILVTALVLMAIAFGPIWWVYSLKIALNYLVGACTGVVYLKLLARNVERLGTQSSQVGKSQLAVVIGVIIVALQWKQLEIIPVFLGFLTLKAAILVYTLKTVAKPQ
jgi:ATP synthase protein I